MFFYSNYFKTCILSLLKSKMLHAPLFKTSSKESKHIVIRQRESFKMRVNNNTNLLAKELFSRFLGQKTTGTIYFLL